MLLNDRVHTLFTHRGVVTLHLTRSLTPLHVHTCTCNAVLTKCIFCWPRTVDNFIFVRLPVEFSTGLFAASVWHKRDALQCWLAVTKCGMLLGYVKMSEIECRWTDLMFVPCYCLSMECERKRVSYWLQKGWNLKQIYIITHTGSRSNQKKKNSLHTLSEDVINTICRTLWRR